MAEKKAHKEKTTTRSTRTKQNKGGEQTGPFKKDEFPVIGIGASAGGLDAFSKFFSAMPGNSGMAFVLIQHLDPSHTSNMVSILKRQTAMPVAEVVDGMKLETDHVYMVPPNKVMTITDRTLKLGEQVERPGISHSIDLFFRSLAEDLKERAIGIIMSGTGSDGSLGARAIKGGMGMVMVQEPDSAGYDGMPRAAIAAGVYDFVLPAEEMPEHLIDYVRKSYGKRQMRREQIRTDSNALANILSLVKGRTKHDFSGYKQTTINRRIERRMGINRIDDVNNYLKYLREHTLEVDALAKDFLINVTAFFRDTEAFDVLKESIKQLMQKKPNDYDLRAWVPGCSTGEEAYSIAIMIEEAQNEIGREFNYYVFGSDLDDDAIAIARKGIYPLSINADVNEERLNRFFTRKDDQLQVKKEIRKKLIFAVQDIIVDPPFTKMDLISARNMLIYFESELQQKLLPMFNYALNEGGLLFLGTAETVGEFNEGFETINQKWKIYREKKKTKEPLLPIVRHPSWQQPSYTHDYTPARPGIEQVYPLERIIMEAMPPAVLVDKDYQVLYTHGATGKYLQLPEGTPEMNILGLVRSELHMQLSSGLYEAHSQQKRTEHTSVRVKVNGETVAVKMTITPVRGDRGREGKGQLVVTFEEVTPPKRSKKEGKDDRTVELERELQFTQETLRGTIEELETANEELRSANEEYQSTNEELQSTNEELETSREELQSLNEELNTVNAEHQKKIEELSTINDDMKNVLSSTGIATIFLDEDLRVQRFTPAATNIFNFIDSDVGRLLSDITNRLDTDTLPNQAQQVLETLVPIKQIIKTSEGKWYSLRIHPYRTTENNIAGVGISFIDITEKEGLMGALAFSQDILEMVRHPVLVLADEFKVEYANRAFYTKFRASKKNTEGKYFFDLGNGQWNQKELKERLERVLPGNTELEDFTISHTFAGGGSEELLLSARPLRSEGDSMAYIVLAIDDRNSERGKERSKEIHPR